MWKNLIRLTTLTLLTLSASLTAYSQKTILDKGDTLICFTVKQSKFLLKEHYRAEECDTLKSICEAQSQLKDSVIKSDKKIQNDLSLVIKNKDSEIALQDLVIDDLRKKILLEQKATRRQKFYKWLSITGGCVATGFVGFLYITK